MTHAGYDELVAVVGHSKGDAAKTYDCNKSEYSHQNYAEVLPWLIEQVEKIPAVICSDMTVRRPVVDALRSVVVEIRPRSSRLGEEQ